MNVRPEGVFFVCKNLEVTPMNNTIPFHPAAHAPQITVDVNILSMLKQAASRLTEMASENVYLAAIGPDMELTIIVEEDAPSILPCFDEDDALIAVKGAPLFISYNPAQVLKMGGKHYLTGPVIFYRTDGHSTIVSLTVEDPGQCDGQSGYGVTTLDAVVESIVCMKFEEILECSKSNLLEEMRRKDLDAAKKETTRWKEEVQTKVDEQDALKKEMIRVIQGTSGLDREMIQQMVNENKEALLTAQTNLADSEKKLKEIEEQNQKAERNCSDLFTWASTYKGASFERRQAILKQFIKEVRVGRDYNIEIVLNVPLDEFEEFKRHAASAGRGKNQKNKSQNPQKVGRCTSNAGIVVLDKTAGETVSIVPKNAAHAILRC